MKIEVPKWLVHALLALFSWGVFGFLSKLGADRIPPNQMQMLFTAGMFTLAIPALLHSRSGSRSNQSKVGIASGTLTGFFAGIANIAVFMALRTGKASLVFPVTSLYPAVTVLLAVIILRERMNRIQLGGVALAVIAIVILSV